MSLWCLQRTETGDADGQTKSNSSGENFRHEVHDRIEPDAADTITGTGGLFRMVGLASFLSSGRSPADPENQTFVFARLARKEKTGTFGNQAKILLILIAVLAAYDEMKGADMAYLRALISAFVVSIVLNWILGRNLNKSSSADMYHFTARGKRSLIIIGSGGFGLFAVIELGAFFSHQEIPLLETVLLALLIGLPGLYLCIATIPGIWEIRVDGDDVTVTKLFWIKTHWKISEIDRCVAGIGDIRVYVKGRKRTAFLVDVMFDHYNTFLERINEEQIPFIIKSSRE